MWRYLRLSCHCLSMDTNTNTNAHRKSENWRQITIAENVHNLFVIGNLFIEVKVILPFRVLASKHLLLVAFDENVQTLLFFCHKMPTFWWISEFDARNVHFGLWIQLHEMVLARTVLIQAIFYGRPKGHCNLFSFKFDVSGKCHCLIMSFTN